MKIKKSLAVAIILLFLGMSISSTGTNVVKKSAMTLNGNTLYVGGTGEGNYTKIQDAINDASDGDTVFVYDNSSPYNERLNVDKSINLIGENKDTTVIDSKGYVIELSADWVNISGFTIRNGECGINIGSNYNTISSNNIHSNIHGGINLKEYSNNNTITDNNIISNTDYGINIHHSNNNTITDNNITSNNEHGIAFYFSNNNTINGNTIQKCGTGIGLSGSNNTIKGNTVTSNINGVVDLGGISNTISGNNISNNKYGILLDYSNYNNITKNNIQDNEKFGLFLSTANYNVIESNNFIGNKIQAFFVFSWRNKWEGNYWDKPREYPKPIFGNIGISPVLVFVIDSLIPLPYFVFDILLSLSVFFCTHFPSWVNFDWHPAKEPYDIGV